MFLQNRNAIFEIYLINLNKFSGSSWLFIYAWLILWVLCRIPRTEQAMASASFLQLNLCSCAVRSASGLMKMTASWWDIVCFITLDRFPYIFFILINSEKVQWKRFQFQWEHINMFLPLFEVLKFILYIYCRWKKKLFHDNRQVFIWMLFLV